jgi:type IV pilus assembly protein PilQ
MVFPLVLFALPAFATPAHRVTRVEISGAGDTATVYVRGWHETAFTAFHLDDPQRVVIDLKNTDVSAVASAGKLPGSGPVLSISAHQFNDPQSSVGRLTLATRDGVHYDVHVAGEDLAIAVHADASPAKPVAQLDPVPAPLPAPPVAVPVPPAPLAAATAPGAPADATPAEPSAAPATPDNVLKDFEDRVAVHGTPGTRLLEARLFDRGSRTRCELHANGPIAAFHAIELKGPGRLAIDLEGFSVGVKPKETTVGLVTGLRVARHDDKVRVVLESGGERFPEYTIKRVHNGLVIAVGQPDAAPAVAAAPVPVPEKAPVAPTRVPSPAPVAALPSPKAAPVAASPLPAGPPSEIKSLDVSGHGRTARVVLALTRAVETSEETLSDGSHLLILKNARLPKELARRLDTSALEGPLESLASYEEPSDHTVRLVAKYRPSEPDVNDTITPLRVGPSFGISWHFAGNGTRKLTLAASSRSPGGFMGEAPAYAMNAGPRAAADPAYVGRRVDFTAKDLDIVQFLQAIGEIAHKNIVASDDINGKVSIRLRNVPWDEALDIVLRTKSLGKEEIGSVIRIAPLEKLRKEQSDKIVAQKDHETVEPLKVRLIPVNFAPAQGISAKVRDLLSSRGTVTVDDRTNVLIVKDIPESIAKVELLVRSLDTQTPQVLIEARIVEASSQFSRSFGIQWGGNAAASTANANQTGVAFPGNIGVSGVSNDGPGSGTSATPNWIVNFPTAVGQGNGAGIGFIFGSANGAQILNLRLTAAELGGLVKTVSAPKTVTLDNQAATIGQGVSIPYSVVSAAGANTAFVQARLELTVTPHVTADGSVLMKISVTNNQVNTGLTGSNGQPSINTREANTNVLVKDGDTTVIGGIYTRQTSKSENKVPFLADIPILGALFSHSTIEDDRDEMLIFITPRIINRQQSVVTNVEPTAPGTSPSP